ncbi:MAG TPA: LppX_LprAFG lipoprotein [Nocardioides sp.]|nr:LppX_LprAFG lipoprotein [Nocardioides sp.]
MLRRTRVALACAVIGLGPVLGLAAGCSDDQGSVSDRRSPDEVMALAKTTLDETSGVNVSLKTTDLPAGVTGVKEATGVGVHPPAFDGSLTVMLSGTDFNVPVIAVDNKVYAQIPLTPGWSDVDPAEYGAPDPATLMSPKTGFSSLLPATEGLKEGESVRGGEDNKEVLTEFTGTVPDSAVRNILPGATGDFDATYTITADGELREAVLTGVFYPNTDSMTYTIGFEDYGTEKKITAP